MRGRRALVLAGLFIGPCLAAGRAVAHLGDLSYSEIQVRNDAVYYTLKFAAHLIPGIQAERKLTRQEVVAAEPQLLGWLSRTVRVSSDEICEPRIEGLVGPDQADDLIVVLRYQCPSPVSRLRVEFRAFAASMPSFQNIASVRMGDRSLGYVFTTENPLLIVPALGEEASTESSFRRFFALGVEHIWTGYDHLLFLLALFLPGGTLGRIAGIVTAFTIAHSITLSIAALGLVRLPVAPVEIAIAASIVYVAAMSLRRSVTDHRWQITFGFGLIHGFGFASVLETAGLAPHDLVRALLAFNLGVEAGQLVVVVAAIPILRLLLRGSLAEPLRAALGWLIIAAGVFWISERTAALL
jgi:hydrogenase/urease accessory protein HupE